MWLNIDKFIWVGLVQNSTIQKNDEKNLLVDVDESFTKNIVFNQLPMWCFSPLLPTKNRSILKQYHFINCSFIICFNTYSGMFLSPKFLLKIKDSWFVLFSIPSEEFLNYFVKHCFSPTPQKKSCWHFVWKRLL